MQSIEQVKTAAVHLLKSTEMLYEERQRLVAEVSKLTYGITQMFDYPAFEELENDPAFSGYFDIWFDKGLRMFSNDALAYRDSNNESKAMIEQLAQENRKFFVHKGVRLSNQIKILNHTSDIYRRTAGDIQNCKEIIGHLQRIFAKIRDKMNEIDIAQQEENIFDRINRHDYNPSHGNYEMDQESAVYQR